MAQQCFPFNSVNNDRVYKAEDFRSYFAQFISNGVFYKNANALKVVAGDDMTVTVNAGAAWVAGAGYINDSALSKTIDISDGAFNRIDRVVIRCDYQKRDIYAAVLKGEYSENPTPKALTRNADAYELGIADILVSKGVTRILQKDITDTRLNNALCGIVTGLIDQADTTDIFSQLENYLNEFKKEYALNFTAWANAQSQEFIGWREEEQNEFTAWVNTIKDILDDTAAGNLQTEIEEEQKRAAKDAFNRYYGLINSVTEFMPDGSIVTSNDECTVTVTKEGTKTEKRIIETIITKEREPKTYRKVTTITTKTDATNKTIREEYTEI